MSRLNRVPIGAGRRLRAVLLSLLSVILLAGTLVAAAVVVATPAAAESLMPLVTAAQGISDPVASCYDSAGNLYVLDDNGQIFVNPAFSGTLFGHAVTAGTPTEVAVVSGSAALACNSGDLFVSYGTNSSRVLALSCTSTEIFGTFVTADTLTPVLTEPAIDSLAFDQNGNLYYTDDTDGTVDVLPAATGSIFGHSVSADTPTTLVTGLSSPTGLAFDPFGDLFIADSLDQTLTALPSYTGTLFGTSVTVNTPATLETGLSLPQFDYEAVAADSSGDVFVSDGSGVSALASSTGTLFDTPVTGGVLTPLNITADVMGVTVNPSDQLVMDDPTDNAVVEATLPTADVTGVTFSGPNTDPQVVVTGTGFGSEPGATTGAGCSASGVNLPYGDLTLDDRTQGWQAGYGNDCIGVNVSSWSTTQITFTFGSWYTDQEVSTNTELQPGDTYTVDVDGSYFSSATPLIPSVTALSPTSGPLTGGTTVTITGTHLLGASAVDFGSAPATSFEVKSDTSITAVDPAGAIGAVEVSVTTWYPSPSTPADNFTYTPAVEADYACTLPAPLGVVDFPVVLSSVPAPPHTITRGGTFPTALAAQVTVPASVINEAISAGATQFTVGSQTVTIDGTTSMGAPSGAVSPDTEQAAATDLPATDQDFVSNTPYTFDTTYNPVTWQTGPGTGLVDFVPGAIVDFATYVIHGTPSTLQITCRAPSGVAALNSTTVTPPTSTPSFQVPATTPPLQNQVSAGTDGGWAVTIANTSEDTVTKVSAAVTATDGGPTVAFDTAAMAASGTSCSPAGSGKLTCSVGELGAGDSATLDVLVDTGDLTPGASIAGAAAVTSSNASGHSSSLGAIEVTVVQAGNGIKAVAAPGIPLASTKKPLRTAKAKVTLTLPKKTAKKAGARRALPFVSAAIIGNQPPVAVTLQSLPSSAEPALCPQTGSTRCQGNIVEAFGNFAAYTSKLTPITAVVQFFYGATIPTGSVYFLKPNGKTVDKLSLCKKTANGYDTPCLATAERHLGTTGNRYAQDTVYFTGNDPVMGRR